MACGSPQRIMRRAGCRGPCRSSIVVVSNPKGRWMRKTAVGLFVAIELVTLMIGGISVWFEITAAERDSVVMISTFAIAFTVMAFIITVTGFRRGERWAWLALWVYPAFFVSHVVLLGVVIPDLILAVLLVAALLMARPDPALRTASTGPVAAASSTG